MQQLVNLSKLKQKQKNNKDIDRQDATNNQQQHQQLLL